MPRFLYSVCITLVGSFFAFIYILISRSPEETGNIIMLLSSLCLCVTCLGSLCLYKLRAKKVMLDKEKRLIYRKSLKDTFVVSFFIFCIGLLRAMYLLNVTTLVLFTLLYLFSIYLLKKFSK